MRTFAAIAIITVALAGCSCVRAGGGARDREFSIWDGGQGLTEVFGRLHTSDATRWMRA